MPNYSLELQNWAISFGIQFMRRQVLAFWKDSKFKAWFRRRIFQVPNLTDSDGAPCDELKLS